MNRRNLLSMLALVMVFVMVLSACAPATPKPTEPPIQTQAPVVTEPPVVATEPPAAVGAVRHVAWRCSCSSWR